MGARTSAGLLMYRRDTDGLRVFLVHPGGPYFRRRDEGAWSLPKGEVQPGEDPLSVARREFAEETGRTPESCAAGPGPVSFEPLGSVRQRGGKTVHGWAFEGDWPAGAAPDSNTFSLEWPPRSGRTQLFPEVDRAELFPIDEAHRRINPAQSELLDRLRERLRERDAT